MKQIKNENDFIGFLISVKSDENDIDTISALKASNLSEVDFLHFIDSLSSKGFLKYIDTQTYHMFPERISSYRPTYKRILLCISKMLILTVKNVIIYVGGILSGVIVAYLSLLIIK